jgi:hypothetical protein
MKHLWVLAVMRHTTRQPQFALALPAGTGVQTCTAVIANQMTCLRNVSPHPRLISSSIPSFPFPLFFMFSLPRACLYLHNNLFKSPTLTMCSACEHDTTACSIRTQTRSYKQRVRTWFALVRPQYQWPYPLGYCICCLHHSHNTAPDNYIAGLSTQKKTCCHRNILPEVVLELSSGCC